MLQTKPRRSAPESHAVRTQRCGRHSSVATASGAEVAYAGIAAARIEDVPAGLPGFVPSVATQLEPGPVCCHLESARSARAGFSWHRIVRQLHLGGTIDAGWLVLGFVRRSGQKDGAGQMLCAAPRHSVDWVLRPGDELFVVGLTQAVLRRAAPEFLTVLHHKERWQTDPEATEDMVAMLSGVLRRARLERIDASSCEELALAAFFEARAREHPGARGDNQATSLFERACRTARGMRRGFRVSELCLALRVSPRSLLAAFTAVTGMGPHAYFMRQRLSTARHLLAGARPRRPTVTEAALSAGFTELGRFAGRYRAFFGENPSQTLLRSGGATGRLRSCASFVVNCL